MPDGTETVVTRTGALKELLSYYYGLEVRSSSVNGILKEIRERRSAGSEYIPPEVSSIIRAFKSLDHSWKRVGSFPQELQAIQSVDDLKRYLANTYGIEIPDNSADLNAIVEAVRRASQRRRIPHYFNILLTIGRLRRGGAIKSMPAAAEQVEPGVRLMGGPVHGFRYSFQKITWAPSPHQLVSPGAPQITFFPYGAATVQEGRRVNIGALLPGDIAIAYVEPTAKSGTIQHLPSIADDRGAMETIRDDIRKSWGSSFSVLTRIARGDNRLREESLTTPYHAEIEAVRTKHAELLSLGSASRLRGFLILATTAKGGPPPLAETLLRAAVDKQVDIVGVVTVSPLPGEEVIFSNADGGSVMQGGRQIASLAGDRDLSRPLMAAIEGLRRVIWDQQVGGESLALLESSMIPTAIGRWGMDPEAFKKRLDDLAAVIEHRKGKQLTAELNKISTAWLRVPAAKWKPTRVLDVVDSRVVSSSEAPAQVGTVASPPAQQGHQERPKQEAGEQDPERSEAAQFKEVLWKQLQLESIALREAKTPWEIAAALTALRDMEDVSLSPKEVDAFLQEAVRTGKYGLRPQAMKSSDDVANYLWLRFDLAVDGNLKEISEQLKRWHGFNTKTMADLQPVIERLRGESEEARRLQELHKKEFSRKEKERAIAGVGHLAEMKQRIRGQMGGRADISKSSSMWELLRDLEAMPGWRTSTDRAVRELDAELETHRETLRALARPEWIDSVADLRFYLSLMLNIATDGTLNDAKRGLQQLELRFQQDKGAIEEVGGIIGRMQAAAQVEKMFAESEAQGNLPLELQAIDTTGAFAVYVFRVYGVSVHGSVAEMQRQLAALKMKIRNDIAMIDRLGPVVQWVRALADSVLQEQLRRRSGEGGREATALKKALREQYGLQIEGGSLWEILRNIEFLRRKSPDSITPEIDAFLGGYRKACGRSMKLEWVDSPDDLRLFVSLRLGITVDGTLDELEKQVAAHKLKLRADLRAMAGDSPLMQRLRAPGRRPRRPAPDPASAQVSARKMFGKIEVADGPGSLSREEVVRAAAAAEEEERTARGGSAIGRATSATRVPRPSAVKNVAKPGR